MAQFNFSSFDLLVQKFLFLKYFRCGWGDPQAILNLMRLRRHVTNLGSCLNLVNLKTKLSVQLEEETSKATIYNGYFRSPFLDFGNLPKESELCFFKMVLCKDHYKNDLRPLCILYAGTGEHNFGKRYLFTSLPLLRNKISTIIIESPFYGFRKPANQCGSQLNFVSDVFTMGSSLIFESMILLKLSEEFGFGPLGLSGVSMGGHMASLVAANWTKPIVLVPILSWTTASIVFTTGVISQRIDWDLLEKQYFKQFKNVPEFQQLESLSELACFDKNNLSLNKLETMLFFQALFDDFTHIKNYKRPIDTSLITSISAVKDAYIPLLGRDITAFWPNASRKYINTGHVGGYLFQNSFFNSNIVDTFNRAISSASRSQ